VDKNQIWIDDEDEYLSTKIQLDNEEYWHLPKDFYLPYEWQEIIIKKVRLKNRLRKLKEKISYDNNVAD
jgi:hypothetical protein